MLKSKYYEKFPDNLTFNCYMLFALASYKQTYRFVPIVWREEDQVSNVKMTRQAWQTLKMAVSYFFGRKKFMLKDASCLLYTSGRKFCLQGWHNAWKCNCSISNGFCIVCIWRVLQAKRIVVIQ